MITDKTSLMIYGQSDSGKSTQARYIAQYVHAKYGKKTRLIALDRGSLWAPCQDLVDSGIVIPCEFPTASEFNPMAVMRKFRRGEWPQEGVINAPTRVASNGKVQYKTNTTWTSWGERESEEIGAIIIDSLTTFATSFMSDAKQKNVRSGAEGGVGQVREEDGEQTGTNTISHYGDAHLEVLDAIQSFQALPVHITMFTALEGKGEDDDSGVKRIALGPQTIGKAINAVIPSRVSNCFHLQAEGTGKEKKVKAWYAKHPSDIPKCEWPAKVAMLPHELPYFWKKYPNGYLQLSLDQGIAEFLTFRDSLRGQKVEEVATI